MSAQGMAVCFLCTPRRRRRTTLIELELSPMLPVELCFFGVIGAESRRIEVKGGKDPAHLEPQEPPADGFFSSGFSVPSGRAMMQRSKQQPDSVQTQQYYETHRK